MSEPEATAPPTRDERQRRIDHAEMLRAHRDSKQRPRKTPDFDKLAKLYQVCPRTVRRWWDAGCNVECLEAVANHLLGLKAPKSAAIENVQHQLTESIYE